MQRVAIARALINNPDILLADEPTGALDSETSVQIMELLKEIAKDRLIIMVTHNPELADQYSSRVIRLMDGNIIDDTNPYSSEELESDLKEKEKKIAESGMDPKKSKGRKKKTSMSFFTAMSLSMNNLMTKKGRTIMTAFAGSIGIIGIALILSISNGVQVYIDHVEEDTLSSYPLTIESETVDMSVMMEAMMGSTHDEAEAHDLDAVYSNDIMIDMMSTVTAQITRNDLAAFKQYLESDDCKMQDYTNAIQYGYNLDLQIFKSDTDTKIERVNPSDLFESMGFGGAGAGNMLASYDVWQEMLGNQTLLSSQYDVLEGSWPDNYDEVVLVVDENNEISDYVLYALGLLDSSEVEGIMSRIMSGEVIEGKSEVTRFTYEDILNTTYKLVLNTDYYEKTESGWTDKSKDDAFMKEAVDNGMTLKIVGIVRPSENAVSSSISGAIGYTEELTEYVIAQINDAEIVKEQLADPETDVFTGLPFDAAVVDETQEEMPAEIPEGAVMPENMPAIDFTNMTSEDMEYISSLSEEQQAQLMEYYQQTMAVEETENTYDGNLALLGVVDLANPSTINLYPASFQGKDDIENLIAEYNEKMAADGREEYEIQYTDMVGMMMSSITTIINVISYVLIAFVAISLIVSSIMIGIITYISVLERTKEIGILRSIGASKRDISRVFNAETLIVGFVAGMLGILVTLLLLLPINAIIYAIGGISGIAQLPVAGAVILVLISMFLTFIAGLIPSKYAAKRNPVEALRSE